MSTATTLAAYGAALVVVFGTAAGVGNAVGPVGVTAGDTHDEAPHGAGTAPSPGHAVDGHDSR